MKPLLLAASAASLLALATPVMAQGYVVGPSANPYDGPMHNAPDRGPQMQYMSEHGSTVLDRAPYGGGDAYSDDLNNHEGRTLIFKHPGLYQDDK